MIQAGSDANDPYFRARVNAERTLRLAKHSRELARLTRLRLRLEAMAASLRARPGTGAPPGLLAEILDEVMAAAGAPRGNIQLADRRSGALRIHAQRGFDRPFLDFFDVVHEGEAACGAALQQTVPVVVEDVETSALFTAPSRTVMRNARAAAVQSIALVTAERNVGVISVHYPDSGISASRQAVLAVLAPPIAKLVDVGLCA